MLRWLYLSFEPEFCYFEASQNTKRLQMKKLSKLYLTESLQGDV